MGIRHNHCPSQGSGRDGADQRSQEDPGDRRRSRPIDAHGCAPLGASDPGEPMDEAARGRIQRAIHLGQQDNQGQG